MTDRIRLVDIHLTPDEHAAVTANLTGWLQLGDDPLIRSAINKLAATEQARPTPRLDHIRRQVHAALNRPDDGSTSTADLVTVLAEALEQARRDLADTRATLTATSRSLAGHVWQTDGEQTLAVAGAIAALDTWGQHWHRRIERGATPVQAADIALLAAYDGLERVAPAPGSATRAPETSRRELLAEMTRVSVAAGLYDITADEVAAGDVRCPSRIATGRYTRREACRDCGNGEADHVDGRCGNYQPGGDR